MCCIAAAFTTFAVMLPKAFDCIPLSEEPEQAYQEVDGLPNPALPRPSKTQDPGHPYRHKKG